MSIFSKMAKSFEKAFSPRENKSSPEYVEINTGKTAGRAKIMVRPFYMRNFEDVRGVLEALRTGYTIALVNVEELKKKDIVELKRAVSKIKKTCDALEGDIAGFENLIIATPSFAKIHRGGPVEKVEER